jgi:hypothetical protein
MTQVLDVARRAWESPGAFALVFVAGFLFTFVPGAIWKLRSPDLEAMIASGQANTVVAMLEEREKAGRLGDGEWVVYGHAINAAYGTYRRAEMLLQYSKAVERKHVDATALQDTIDALGDAAVQKNAIGVLRLAWPKDLAVEERLQERTGDDNVLLRHGAIDALVARSAAPAMVRSARARVAVVDLRTRVCPTAKDGLDELQRLVNERAVDALRERKAADALLDLQGDADLAQMPCLKKALVRSVQQEVAALLEGGG